MKRIFYILSLIILFAPLYSMGQKYSVTGHVYDNTKKNPIYYATVNIKGTQIYDLTDKNGLYKLDNITPGKYTIVVRILGYQEIEKNIEIKKTISNLDFYLKESSLALKDIVVTAKVSQSKKGSTTYKIGNDAIKQIQPISVNDILQLIPGNQIKTADLSQSSHANLRSAGGNDNINSFGTSVIVDGNQLSNDGNMQEVGINNNANKGIDLRQISASNIESVEVISGVASAKYGNITSGAIIINRKAGYTPWHLNINNTPNSYQGAVGKGFRLKQGGFLNADLDYTYSNGNPTSRKRYFQRINTSMRWSNEFSEKLNWNNNLSLNLGYAFDGQRNDPDQTVKAAEMESKNTNIQFSTNGGLKLLGETNYSFSANYSYQYSYKDIPEDGPIPVIESLEEGTFFTVFTPILFFQKTKSYGEPLNINARIDNEQSFKTFDLRHNVNLGMEYSYNKNFGKGRVMDKENNTSATGARDMNFHNVPATEIYSIYFQDDINICKDKSNHLIKLGIRYDNMLRKYNLFSPRISFSGKYFERFRIRMAYGVSYKAPSMLQLYPGPKYVDIINLNHYSEDKARSMAVVTTYLFQPENENLKPSRGTTIEGGVDFEYKGLNIRLTGFHKELERGIQSTENIIAYEKRYWEVIEEFEDKAPVVGPTDNSIYILRNMSNYTNSSSSESNGIELSAQFPKIETTNTTINLSGSYISTLSKTNVPDIASSFANSGSQNTRYGVYERASYKNSVCRSNMTIIQHIPAIKLLVTLVCEGNWIDKSELDHTPSIYPIGFYESDGTYVDIPLEKRTNEEYADLKRSSDFYKTFPKPEYFNFHLQLRKETKQGHSFSFFANNFLWYNPTYKNDISKQKTYLNTKISFGLGVNFKL